MLEFTGQLVQENVPVQVYIARPLSMIYQILWQSKALHRHIDIKLPEGGASATERYDRALNELLKMIDLHFCVFQSYLYVKSRVTQIQLERS